MILYELAYSGNFGKLIPIYAKHDVLYKVGENFTSICPLCFLNMTCLEQIRRSRTVHYTFRINEEVLSNIQKEAESNSISVSGMINQILAQYISRDKYFEELGFVPISKEMLRRLMCRIQEDTLIRDSGELGSSDARECIAYIFHQINASTLLQFLDLLCSGFQSFSHESNGRFHRYAVNHGVSIQFSMHLKEYLRALIEQVLRKRIDFLEITPNIVVFAFEA